MGIRGQQQFNIKKRKHQFWFADYIDYSPPKGSAHVVLHLQFNGFRKSATNLERIRSGIETNAAYVVKEILYGSSGLLILEQPFESSETEEIVEERLFLAAKCFADKTEDFPSYLDSATCRFYCDLPYFNPEIGPFSQCMKKLHERLAIMADTRNHIPISITLCHARISSNGGPTVDDQDFAETSLLFTVINNLIPKFHQDCLQLLNDPIVQRFGRLRPYLMEFHQCMELIRVAVYKVNTDRLYHLNRLWETYFASGVLTEWIARRKRGLAVLVQLFEGIALPFVPVEDLVRRDNIQVFMLKSAKKRDPLFEQFREDFGHPNSIDWSVLEIVSASNQHICSVQEQLTSFSSRITTRQLFISCSTTEEDGTILDSIEPSPAAASVTENIVGVELVSNGALSIRRLTPDNDVCIGNMRWFQLGEAGRLHRTVVLIGATGSGRSLMVDSIVNYILGVQSTDNFRFQICSEDNKLDVVAYTVHSGSTVPISVTVIDTPGYTGHPQLDDQNTSLVAQFLAHENSTWTTVDAICLVADSASVDSSSPGLKNALKALPVLFGSYFAPKTHWFCTFSREKEPPVFPDDPSVPSDSHFHFDNSVLFAQGTSRKKWKRGWANFRSFFLNLQKRPIRFLEPKRALHQQDELLKTLDSLNGQIDETLEELEPLYEEESGDGDEKEELKDKLTEHFRQAAKVAYSLKSLGCHHPRVQHVRFQSDTPHPADFIRYVRSQTHQSELRQEILQHLQYSISDSKTI